MYKMALWDEIYICTQHLGFSYSDVISMPTCERRYFLSKRIRENQEKEEQLEERRQNNNTRGSKGSRTTRVSGNALKQQLNSGKIPI